MSAPGASPRLDPRRRALLLLVGSGVALLGVLTLAVLWISLGVGTLRAGAVLDEPCLAAYDAAADGTDIRYTAFPPQAICTWTVDGEPREVVVQRSSTAVFGAAAVAALGGIGLVAGVFVVGRRG
ncbi:hypothetical protein AB6N24_19010 [Cellulomonas sp. 179-A 4D5 NHS]|uniref:hypothetical protein n=1 Tax=Cellulomonas sp. 179-A 4D5 NHS TaxID=3142378 RepID=UPI0039A0B36D